MYIILIMSSNNNANMNDDMFSLRNFVLLLLLGVVVYAIVRSYYKPTPQQAVLMNKVYVAPQSTCDKCNSQISPMETRHLMRPSLLDSDEVLKPHRCGGKKCGLCWSREGDTPQWKYVYGDKNGPIVEPNSTQSCTRYLHNYHTIW
jgi:hypothetical protein